MATLVKVRSPEGEVKTRYSVDARELCRQGWTTVDNDGAAKVASPPEKIKRAEDLESLVPVADPPGSQTRGGAQGSEPNLEVTPNPKAQTYVQPATLPLPGDPLPGEPSDFGPGDTQPGGDVKPPQGALADEPSSEVPGGAPADEASSESEDPLAI